MNQPLTLGFASADGYDDFVVDGEPLYGLLFPDHKPGNVTPLSPRWPRYAEEAIAELLGERAPELTDGRIPLYVCSECADLGCGALTAEIVRTDQTVTWKDFGWQDSLQDGWDVGDYEHLSQFEPIAFKSDQYVRVLKMKREEFSLLPTPSDKPPLQRGSWFDRLRQRSKKGRTQGFARTAKVGRSPG